MVLKRSKKDFFNKIALKDPKTKTAYDKRIAVWEDFCKIKFNDSEFIPENKDDSLEALQLFVNWYSIEAYNHRTKGEGHSPNSVWNYASSIRKYLFYRGSPLTRDDTQEFLELPSKIDKELHGLTLDEIIKILDSMNYDYKTMFMVQLSSGMRIGELVQLKKKHLILLDSGRFMMKIPAKIAKLKKARTTFMSKEATKLVMMLWKRSDDEDLLFTKNKDSHIAEVAKGNTLREHLELVGLGKRYEDTNNYEINTHSFRAYFITKVSRHDENLAKLLAGEKGYLLQYDRMSDEEKLGIYEDAEKDLLVYDNSRKDEEIKKLRVANTVLAEQSEEIKELKKKQALVEEFIMRSKRID